MTSAAIDHDALIAVRPLSVVAEGEEFIVGDPSTGVYVVLPKVGVRVLELLRENPSIRAATAAARAEVGEEVDVADFARALVELGFAASAEQPETERSEEQLPAAPPAAGIWLRSAFGGPAWAFYAGAFAAVVTMLCLRPALFPRPADLFFLSTPVRSLAALTVLTYALAAAHEGCHWLAARAIGVPARISIGRRLYFLVLEIDLSGLWGLPRRRRYGPLLAGMAFDSVALFVLLGIRWGDGAGWWSVSPGVGRLLAAVTFVEIAAILSQCWVFARTDLYAVLITVTGCVNLSRVNQLMVRRALRRLDDDQARELANAHPRDVAVARWFRWVYVAGVTGATWFFATYFAPATIRLVSWLGGVVVHARLASEPFWEALLFGGLILAPRAMTLAVATRDVIRWRTRSAANSS